MGDMLTPEMSAAMTRRQFFRRSTAGIAIGIPALATLLSADGFAADTATDPKTGGLVGLPRLALGGKCGSPTSPPVCGYCNRSENRRTRGAAAFPAQGQTRHLSAPVRGALADELFDYKPD